MNKYRSFPLLKLRPGITDWHLLSEGNREEKRQGEGKTSYREEIVTEGDEGGNEREMKAVTDGEQGDSKREDIKGEDE